MIKSTAIRNAQANAVTTDVDSGAGTAVVRVLGGVILLTTHDMAVPSFDPAVSGTITANAIIDDTGITDGTADNFEINNRDGSLSISGSVTGVGGGGELIIDNPNIETGEVVKVVELTYTASP